MSWGWTAFLRPAALLPHIVTMRTITESFFLYYYYYYYYYTHTHTYAQDYISPFINIFTFPAIHPDVNGWTKGTRYTGMYVKVVKYYT